MDPEDEPTSALDDDEDEVPQIDPVTLKPDLYAAAAANDLPKVKELVDMFVPATFIDTRNGWTALHWASMHSNAQMMKLLLASGASLPYHRLKAKEKRAKLALIEAASDKPKNEVTDESEEEKLDPVDIVTGEGEEEEEGQEGGKGPVVEDEGEDEFQENLETALETSVDLTKNTPLLWAVVKMNMRCIWLLLADGYSPNDRDNYDNSALHLAALGGDIKIMKVLIDDGASANNVNIYKNHAVDMAKDKDARDIIGAAQIAGASMTDHDIEVKHEKNMSKHRSYVSLLTDAKRDGARVEDNNFLVTYSASGTSDMIGKLAEALEFGKEWSLDEIDIAEAQRLLLLLESSQDVMADVTKLKSERPIQTQTEYKEKAYKLLQSMKVAKDTGMGEGQLLVVYEVIESCQIEYWLKTLLRRLADVETAMDCHEHDMKRLRQAIRKAESLRATQDLIDNANAFMSRLDAELGMSRAIKAVPNVKLPMENPPEGYFIEVLDKGFVVQTEGYPLPPPDPETGKPGEYQWQEAENFSKLKAAHEELLAKYDGAEEKGANLVICTQAKEVLVKVEKEIKLLDAKNENDKIATIEATKKLAKKMKKGGKKKG